MTSLEARSEPEIILVFGEGGHAEQMRRLLKLLDLAPSQCVSLVDRDGLLPELAVEQYVLTPLRDKIRGSYLQVPLSIFRQLSVLRVLLFSNKAKSLITTGPGICVLPSIIMRLKGGQVIYIETWCRFKSKSMTGRFMQLIASRFYVQNESLLNLYPKAIYGGRL